MGFQISFSVYIKSEHEDKPNEAISNLPDQRTAAELAYDLNHGTLKDTKYHASAGKVINHDGIKEPE